MTLSEADHKAIADNISLKLQAKAEMVPGTVRSIREYVGLGVLALSLLTGGIVTLRELQDKPTVEQVDEQIDKKTAPIKNTVKELNGQLNGTKDKEGIAKDVENIQTDISAIQEIQSYSLDHNAWLGDVVAHEVSGKKGKPPAKPTALKKRERELMTGVPGKNR